MSHTEKDDFWDIDKLLPKKRGSLSPFMNREPIAEITIPVGDGGEDRPEQPGEVLSIPPREEGERREGKEQSGVTTYYPDGHSLIKRVTITKLIDKYDFYGNFRNTAEIFFDYKTPKCEFAPFYSYRPQYSHLTQEQRSYYFYWRDEMSRSHYLKTDYSYIYLYVFEILNLPDRIPPEEGIKKLCTVWREYRKELPKLDAYFIPWVNDYCLVYGLPCPIEEISGFLFDAIRNYYFKEFFISRPGSFEGATFTLLAYLSDYDWTKGKYAMGEGESEPEKKRQARERFRSLMEGAMHDLLVRVWDSAISKGREGRTRILKRIAFPESLCTHAVKCNLEIEYFSLGENAEVRRDITAAVKYTENKIRALMGIKSRLSVKDLPDTYRAHLDTYFDALFKRERAEKARENAPAYERLYDAPKEELSFSGADEIERASWSNTLRLVDTEDMELIRAESELVAVTEDTDSVTVDTVCEDEDANEVDRMGLTDNEIAYLRHKLLGTCYTPEASISEDSIAERINEAFTDGFIGDYILEYDGEGYTLLDDYIEEVKEWLLKITK
ncbi:MAG: TerB N-terminal domain-containing protein [Clostridia bacterium]|nr:TerB N-terminal domain-containing protein [Clostridia bacterium]